MTLATPAGYEWCGALDRLSESCCSDRAERPDSCLLACAAMGQCASKGNNPKKHVGAVVHTSSEEEDVVALAPHVSEAKQAVAVADVRLAVNGEANGEAHHKPGHEEDDAPPSTSYTTAEDETASTTAAVHHAREVPADATATPTSPDTLTAEAPAAAAVVSKCPFLHGSVGCFPYPGYVHGRHPEVCANGCRPDPKLGQTETKVQTLLREAREFQVLFHREMRSTPEDEAKRWTEIEQEIETTGTYRHTFEELQHGARVAWRNAPKCSNRKFWGELTLLDKRDVTSAEGMLDACLEMLESATLHGEGGPRIWNNQLMRYAGWRTPEGAILGDPAEVKFTELVTRKFGWKPPKDDPTAFDILPLVLQPGPEEPPRMFDIPPQYISEVPLAHPLFPWLAELGMRWYGLPAVSNMEMTLGGLLYTGVPFIGWYADTEIVRNLSDERRYNMLPTIAKQLGYSTTENSNLWRDAALVVLNQAITYSFQQASTGMVDHHTLMQQFWEWQSKERIQRGYCPGNWKWIIPPVAASTSKCYLGLNKMTEYTLKPAYLYAPGFALYAKEFFGPRWNLSDEPFKPAVANPYVMKMLSRLRSHSTHVKPRILVVYATVSGTAKEYAVRTARRLKTHFQVLTVDAEAFHAEEHHPKFFHLTLALTSTYGSGAPPSAAFRFLKWLSLQKEDTSLAGCRFAVFGVGSSAYPRFCAAADTFHALLSATGATPLGLPGKGDALNSRDVTYKEWLINTLRSFKDHLTSAQAAQSCERVMEDLLVENAANSFQQLYNLIHVSGAKRLAPDTRWLTAPVLECAEALGAQEEDNRRSVCIVRIDLSALPSAVYSPGDHIAVLPLSSHQLTQEDVEEFAGHLGIENLDDVFDLEILDEDAATEVGFGGKKYPLPNTFRTILLDHVGLLNPLPASALPVLVQFAGGEEDARELNELGHNEQAFQTCDGWIFSPSSGRLPLEVFLQLAPALYPRRYSIASSNWGRERSEVHAMVGLLSYQLPCGKYREGQCSSYLCSSQPGDIVRFKLRMSPMVMVAAGTGFAPFRGFLQHRINLARQAPLGPDDVETALACGALTNAFVAYSREPGRRKQYVQDVIAGQEGDRIKHVLDHPDSHIYICGDSHMSSAVSAAFATLIGSEAMTTMTLNGRFHEDVFGVVLQTADRVLAARQLAADQNVHRPLLKAAVNGDVAEVRRMLGHGRDVAAVDSDGNSLLHIAAETGSLDLVNLLVISGAPTRTINHWNLTPVGLAHVRGQTAVRDAILAAGGTMASGMHKSFYPLHLAAIEGTPSDVHKLLVDGADIWSTDYFGCTALHMAAHAAANALKHAGARITASSTNFSASWPSLSHWSPSNLQTITPEQIMRAQSLWGAISSNSFPREAKAALTKTGILVFKNLFEISPRLLELFPFKDQDGQPILKELEVHALKVMTTLGTVVQGFNDLHTLVPYLRDLTQRHVKYGVLLVHYDIISATLQRTFEQALGTRYTQEDKDIWIAIFGVIGGIAKEVYQ
eukprot:jgi/Chlat1/2694/Chrsp180S02868